MKQPPGVSRFGSVADDLTKILLRKNSWRARSTFVSSMERRRWASAKAV